MPDEQQETNQDESGSQEAVNPDRIFRRECLISDADLRVEIAREIIRTVAGDEVVELNEKSVESQGEVTLNRLGRTRTVIGNYERNSHHHAEQFKIGATVTEKVYGGVELHAAAESEAIMAGSYVNNIAGPWLRLCAWSDFLCWGGWVEADISRVELSLVMIRAYMAVAHAVGARVNLHRVYIDDISNRVEQFGVFTDMTTTVIDVGAPGAGQTLEA